EVRVYDTRMLLTKGETLPAADRLAPLDDEGERLLSVRQNGTIVYRTETASLDPATDEGAGLRADVGPIDLREYGAILYQALGLPLTEGSWTGEATMQALGTGATRLNRLRSAMVFDDVVWVGTNGTEQRLTAGMTLSADILRTVV